MQDAPKARVDRRTERPPFAELFAAENFPTFEITIPRPSWDALRDTPREYQPATFTYGDQVFENVGVRLKGRASFQWINHKPAFKIKFNKFVKGTRFHGLERLTLNNMFQDPALMRECLGYRVFRAMGVAAPLCNHVRVYVNGKYYGLYANVQSLDEVFVATHFHPAPGNLYDISNNHGANIDIRREQRGALRQEERFVLETNHKGPMPDTSDLTALIDAASLPPDREFVEAIEEVMDLEQVLALGAVEAILADWDGYFGASNNYKLYHELERGRFIILPWGIDQTFGTRQHEYQGADYPIDHSKSGRPNGLIHQRCKKVPDCTARYRSFVRQALETFESLDLESELDATLERIRDSALEDPGRRPSSEDFPQAVESLRDYLRTRPMRVRAELEGG